MLERSFKPGFRFSRFDLAILACGIVGTILAGLASRWAGFVIAFVVSHFFLFCNVFRISRRPELAWAATFVLLAAGTILMDFPGWVFTIVVCLGITGRVILGEMGKPWYHGVGWQRLNPALPKWWESHRKDFPN